MARTAGNFWEYKSLDEMSNDEWESLCDGCGRCCLIKLEDEESGEVHYTNVACRLFDEEKCNCSNYSHRTELVPACLVIRPLTDSLLAILPASCAYRRLAEGRKLADWHPLISNDPASVHNAGISVRSKVFPETSIHPEELEHHIIQF